MGTNTTNVTDNDNALKAIEDDIEDLRPQVEAHILTAKLFCHQFIYTSVIPKECAAIL